MKTYPIRTWTRTILPLLFLIIGMIPAKAQLYVGGSFSIIPKKEITTPNSTISNPYGSVSIELGYRHKQFSAGLTYSFFSQELFNTYQHSFKPYLRYDLIVQDQVGFFNDLFYSYIYHRDYYPSFHSINSHLVGLSPGVYYKMTNNLMAVFHFGILGYSSSSIVNGFEGFGVDLSMNTSQIGFYLLF